MDKIRVFTAFSGYDSQCMALDRLIAEFPQFDYELVGWAEIDKYAIQAHFAQVLNAKDYGIPQNRERIFLVSILGDEQYSFPKPFPLELRLKDMLEKEVDEKYYLSSKLITSLSRDNKGFKAMKPSPPPMIM